MLGNEMVQWEQYGSFFWYLFLSNLDFKMAIGEEDGIITLNTEKKILIQQQLQTLRISFRTENMDKLKHRDAVRHRNVQ